MTIRTDYAICFGAALITIRSLLSQNERHKGRYAKFQTKKQHFKQMHSHLKSKTPTLYAKPYLSCLHSNEKKNTTYLL